MRGIRLGRPARRLLIAVVALVAIDLALPSLLYRLERARYESQRVFRFENSDLFPIGPLVQYLREHPRGDRPRVVFFGNSIVWGYFLPPGDALPAAFQALAPEVRVFNMGVNGFETGNAYLITKAVIDSIDTIYLHPIGQRAHASLATLFPVDPSDVRRFALTPPDPVESRLASVAGAWLLYRDAYRLQSALFGMSTRQYIYINKGSIPRAVRRAIRGDGPDTRVPAAAPEVPALPVRAEVAPGTVPESRRRELARAHPLLWELAEIVQRHRKRLVVMEIESYMLTVPPAHRAELNRIFEPHLLIAAISVPRSLTIDGGHLSAEGGRAVARALYRHAPPAVPAGRS